MIQIALLITLQRLGVRLTPRAASFSAIEIHVTPRTRPIMSVEMSRRPLSFEPIIQVVDVVQDQRRTHPYVWRPGVSIIEATQSPRAQGGNRYA
jgi:hypothetical protein